MPTFPQDRYAGRQQSTVVYLEPACKNVAPITDTFGRVIPNGQISASNSSWPLFLSAASVLYYRDASNNVVTMLPAVTASVAQIVTGSKATGAAVTSLIAALKALGIPLTDSTT